MDFEGWERILNWIKQHWYSKRALLVAIILAICLPLVVFYNIDRIDIIKLFTLRRILLIAILVCATIFAWFFNRKLPKNLPDKLGIVVAIKAENETVKIRLKNDFAKELTNIINRNQKQSSFNVIEITEYYASKIKSAGDATKLLAKVKGHFVIYGECKERLIEGKKHYVLALDAIVAHSPIPISVSNQFSKEFGQLFPKKLAVNIDNELIGFEISSDLIAFITKYIISIAAFLSYDYSLSSSLQMALYNELKNLNRAKFVDPLKRIGNKLPSRLVESLLALSRLHYYMYSKTKDKNYLNQMEPVLAQLSDIDPQNYHAHLLRGIYYFLGERNVSAAKVEINRSRNKIDHTWCYSQAFLHAYEEHLDSAMKSYNAAFKGTFGKHVPIETEQFIADVLEIEPDKYQLWFCLGLVNYRVKGDLSLAKADFEKFLSMCPEDKFSKYRKLAGEYLKKING